MNKQTVCRRCDQAIGTDVYDGAAGFGEHDSERDCISALRIALRDSARNLNNLWDQVYAHDRRIVQLESDR